MTPVRSLLLLSLASLLPASAGAAPPGGHRRSNAAALRQALSTQGNPTRKAAAARALGRMGDQQARPLLVALLRKRDRRLVRAANGGLRALDRAHGHPEFLVALKPQNSKQAVQRRHGRTLDQALRKRLERSFALVLSGGEETVLGRAALARHLKWRRLRGVAVFSRATCQRPAKAGAERIIACKVQLLLTTLRTQKMLFASESEAEVATDEDPVAPGTRRLLERQALTAAGEATAAHVAGYLEQQ
jgi:hypothetical protein